MSLRPVLWGQGMFLRPQHFQQQDAYHDARLQRALQLIQPFYWGVRSLSLNETALRNFICEVERCELVLRDGTIIQFHGDSLPSNTAIMPRSFEEVLDPTGKPLNVYLGVKRPQWEERNIAPQPSPVDPSQNGDRQRRFRVQEVETPDVFADDGQGGAVSVRYLVYEVHILFDADLPPEHDYELLKIGEILRVAEVQGTVLSNRYIPPVLTVSASSVLASMLREIRDLLTAKSRALAEFTRYQSRQLFELSPGDMGYVLMAQMVNRYTPLFHHHLEIEETHPCVYYALLRQLIGEFSTFSGDVSVLGGPLPAYRHDRLWECFDAAIRVARSLVSDLTMGPDYVVTLTYDGEYFSARLDDQFFQGNNRYYLAITVDMPPGEVLSRLTETGKISAREDIDALRRQALFGVRIDHQETPPESLPRRAHCMYFAMDHHAELWRRMGLHHNIAVYCDLPSQNTSMQIMLVSEV